MPFLLAISLSAATPFATAEHAQEFCATGLVVHAIQRSLILQSDEGPNLYILTEGRNVPTPGERIVLRGRVVCTRFNEFDHFLSDFKVIGSGPIPPPREMLIKDLVEHPVKNEYVSLQAEVEDYFVDEVDTRFYYLSLKSGPHRIYGAISQS